MVVVVLSPGWLEVSGKSTVILLGMDVLSLKVCIQYQIFMYIILSDACTVENEIVVKLMFRHDATV